VPEVAPLRGLVVLLEEDRVEAVRLGVPDLLKQFLVMVVSLNRGESGFHVRYVKCPIKNALPRLTVGSVQGEVRSGANTGRLAALPTAIYYSSVWNR